MPSVVLSTSGSKTISWTVISPAYRWIFISPISVGAAYTSSFLTGGFSLSASFLAHETYAAPMKQAANNTTLFFFIQYSFKKNYRMNVRSSSPDEGGLPTQPFRYPFVG
jgi:hypothetical protein